MKKIGVLTSGGDSPGMNAAIRAVVRMGIYANLEVIGIRQGYRGLLTEAFLPMDKGSVADIVHRGGTILQTARCEEFQRMEVRKEAIDKVKNFAIDGLVVIGGDGTLRGAQLLWEETAFPIVGVPATIDNDIGGTDFTIGFDTAMNTIIDAVNKVRDTATSHERIFLVEVMGRKRGFLALYAGLAAGAESIVIPECPATVDEICHKLEQGFQRGKKHSIILVAEGVGNKTSSNQTSALQLGKAITEKIGQETRAIILGHLQRGGNPSGQDRILASRLGAEAVKALSRGEGGVMMGLEHNRVVSNPIHKALASTPHLEKEIYNLAQILSR